MSERACALNDAIRRNPAIPCTRPWTSLEERSPVGDWQVCWFSPTILGVIRKKQDTDLLTLWNNEAVTGMRRTSAPFSGRSRSTSVSFGDRSGISGFSKSSDERAL